MASPSRCTEKNNPFRGLEPYKETDLIYGRDSDLLILTDRVYSARTTLLFSASGAGKTSFLLAKALPEFRNDFYCCYIRNWVRFDVDPCTSLLRNMALSIGKEYVDGQSLCGLLSTLSDPDPRRPDGLLIILDQFEELFQAHGDSESLRRLIDQLSDLINDYSIPARVIISMRDDFLGNLNVFDNRIPSLFNNYYNLKSPTERQAREIIFLTAKEYKKKPDATNLKILTEQLSEYSIGARGAPELPAQSKNEEKASASEPPESSLHEPKSMKARIGFWLMRKVRALKRLFVAPPAGPESKIVKLDAVILPYLQIVCRELWERESIWPTVDFLASWEPKVDGADHILRAVCQRTLDALGSERRKDIASRAFDYLMTRQGAKLPYELHMLAEHMTVDTDELKHILHYLSESETRLLREYQRPDTSKWFELYHDMYAVILQDWKRNREAQKVKRRKQWLVPYAIVLLGLVYVVHANLVSVDYSSRIEEATDSPPFDSYRSLKSLPGFGSRADRLLAAYWDRRAQAAGVREDPAHVLIFRLMGLDLEDTDLRRSQVSSLVSSYKDLKTTFRNRTGAEISALAFSPDEKSIAVGNADGTIQVWDIEKGTSLQFLRLRDCSPDRLLSVDSGDEPIRELSFSADGMWLGARTATGLAQAWSTDNQQCSPLWQGTVLLNFSTQGHTVVVGFPNGSIQLWFKNRPIWSWNPLSQVKPRKPTPVTANEGEKAVEPITLANVVYVPRSDPQIADHIFASDSAGNVYVRKRVNNTSDKKSNAGGRSSVSARAMSARTATKDRLGPPSDISPVFSPDGKHMIVSHGKQLELWDTIKQKKIRIIGFRSSRKNPLSFSPRGSWFSVEKDDGITIYDSETGSEHISMPASLDSGMQLLSEHTFFVTYPPGQNPVIVDAKSKTTTEPLPETAVVTAFSPRSRLVATASGKDSVRIWGFDERPKRDIPPDTIALSSTANIVAIKNSDQGVILRDTFSNTILASLRNVAARKIEISPDGNWIAIVEDNNQFSIWTKEGQKIHSETLPASVTSMNFSPGGTELLLRFKSANAPSHLRFFKISEGSPVCASDQVSPDYAADLTPDDDALLLFNANKIDIVHCGNAQPINRISFEHLRSPYALDKGSSSLVVFADGQIQIWSWKTGQLVASIKEDSAPAAFFFGPGGRQLIAVFQDRFKVWKLPELDVLQLVPISSGVSSAYFWPDKTSLVSKSGSLLLTIDSGERTVQLWDLRDGKKKGEDAKLSSPAERPIWFSSDGLRVMVLCSSGWLHVFRLGAKGLIVDENRFIGGVPTITPKAYVPEDNFASIVANGMVQRLSVTKLGDFVGTALPESVKKLLEDFRSKLLLEEENLSGPTGSQ